MAEPLTEPGSLLARLVGVRLYAVTFVVNDYVQLQFDREPSGAPVLFNVDVWPTVEYGGRTWREPDLGYADAMRRLTPGVVRSSVERIGSGIRIELDTGALVIDPTIDEVFVEIGLLCGFPDGAWTVWRPGEGCFAGLAGPSAPDRTSTDRRVR
ncbi:hypothetical protein [Tsukamurella paurometabola]|uniref:Uncharacterized protein n=1 Tax=Tsukamurella paurometabola TaxID=2061 RepID=A0A3P8MC12_TSUPA|nr:hypothetical protein [Tsukamurella paurometabola]UEA84733.1 hypothetical protein LK411_07915 [Tsukamurella paurometabola]VDR37313.1 Uncharacterised protein [Tsukamurella paurometabola]